MADDHDLPGHRHSVLLVALFAPGLLTYAPGSPLTIALVVASAVVLIGFIVGIVVKELWTHRPKRNG